MAPSTPHITPKHPSGPSGLHLSYMVTSWSRHGQWQFHTGSTINANTCTATESWHWLRTLPWKVLHLGVWIPDPFVFQVMATSSDHQLVGWAMFSFGPCFLFNTQQHCYHAMSHVLDSSFARLLSFGSDISCQILCNVATDCTLSRNLRRSIPLTYPAAIANVHNSRVACSETSVILCKRRTALDEMLLFLKMQSKMIVNLSTHGVIFSLQ